VVNMAATKKGEQSPVRFNVYLSRESYEALEKLRVMSGKKSLAETIRLAVQLSLVLQEELGEGSEVLFERNGKTRVLKLVGT